MFLLLCIIILIIIFVLTTIACRRRYPHDVAAGLPPGPMWWPIVGSRYNFWKNRPAVHAHLATKYGPIYHICLAQQLFVFLNSYDLAKEAFTGKNGKIFSGRLHNFASELLRGGSFGITTTDGDVWREQRQFTVDTLHDFGFGRPVLQERITCEISKLLSTIDSMIAVDKETPIDIVRLLKQCVGNVLSSIIFGQTFTIDDPECEERQRRMTENLAILNSRSSALPIHLFPTSNRLGQKRILENTEYILEHFAAYIRQRRADVEASNDEIKNFAHAYIKQMKLVDEGYADGKHFSERQLQAVVADLFKGAELTTVTTLAWIVLFLIHYPENQRSISEEVRCFRAGDMPSSWAQQKERFPYTCAFIAEVQRISPAVPFTIPRVCNESVSLCGYTIPKGTAVMANLVVIHMDPNHFENPNTFAPERFLDQKKCQDAFIPFGVGQRGCLGESFARVLIFRIIAEMLDRYEICAEEDEELPSLEPGVSTTVIVMPKLYRIRLRKLPHVPFGERY